MNRFKSFKNYFTSSTVTTSTNVVSIEQNTTTATKFSVRKNSVDLNLSTKTTEKEEDLVTKPATPLNNSVSRPKFLRSKSISVEERPNLTKLKSNKIGSDVPTGNELFLRLENKLDKLIDHFKQTESLNESVTPPLKDYDDHPLILINPSYFETSDTSSNTYYKLAIHAKISLIKCVLIHNKLEEKIALFDYEIGSIKSNGYRSILASFEACCRRLLNVVSDLNDKKSSFLFQLKLNTSLPVNSSLKELQSWVKLIDKFEIILQTAVDMQMISLSKIDFTNLANTNVPSLFINSKEMNTSNIEANLFYLGSVYQDAFFGRSCGFQFCDSLQIPLTGCAVALASYNDGYEAYSNNKENMTAANTAVNQTSPSSPHSSMTSLSGQATLFKSLFSGTKYILDPELRAKKVSRVFKDANVEFCKSFWQLTETSIVQMGSNLITPQLAVNVLKKVALSTPLKLPRVLDGQQQQQMDDNNFVYINPPQNLNANETVQIRLLSSEMRIGMQELDNIKQVESPSSFISTSTNLSGFHTNTPNSPYLILHVHGGGFIAHSSKSHEIYLKPWCKELKVPIVSIDYSLAPEHAFPRGSEECFYVYAWCLLNHASLGWTGEKIVLVGDSAGGVMVTNIVQRSIINQIRIPDALIPIYTPFMLNYSLSPSRLLSVMDPLLNLGILWRCLAAYIGIDFKLETEKFKQILNLTEQDILNKTTSNKSSPSKTSIISKSLSFRALLSRSTVSNDQQQQLQTETTPSTSFKQNRNSPIRDSSSPDLNYSSNCSNSSDDEKRISTSDQDLIFKNNSDLNMDEANRKRLLHLHKVLGDSVFLVEKLRDHSLTSNQFMSPIFSDDSVLSKFPKTYLIASNDPFFDDNIEMARRLENLNVNLRIILINNGVMHGYLNMHNITKETQDAFEQATVCITQILAEFQNETNSHK